MKEPENPRAFTVKSVLLGLLGAFLVSSLANISDSQINNGTGMISNHLPVVAFFYLWMVVLLWNGGVGSLRRKAVLNGNELFVIFGFTLVSCFAPASGLMRYLVFLIMMPWYYLAGQGKPQWETHHLLEMVPRKFFPDPVPVLTESGGVRVESVDETVYHGFFTGLSEGEGALSFGQVPWEAWLQPMLSWGPLLLFCILCICSLSLLVHRQWSWHEQLTYPIAQFAGGFFRKKPDARLPDVFRNRLFWFGFVPVFSFYLIMYGHEWYQHTIPPISELFPNLRSWWSGITNLFPILKKAPLASRLDYQVLYFSVIGLSYFISSEIGFTMAMNVILMVAVGVVFFILTGSPLLSQNLEMERAGGYLGYVLILAFTGRHYYGPVFLEALGWRRVQRGRRRKAMDAGSVFAARIFLFAFAGFVVALMLSGLELWSALLLAMLVMIMFLVLSRIVCETGIPFIQAGWSPGILMSSVFGPAMIGAAPLMLFYYLGTVLTIDPRESLMPYVSNSLKMAEERRIGLRKVLLWLTCGAVFAVVVSFGARIWMDYSVGATETGDVFSVRHVPMMPFDDVARHLSDLKSLDLYETSLEGSLGERAALFSPDREKLGYFGIGVVLVVLTSLLRYRFARFPLHPVLFLIMGTYAAGLLWFSFLVGWVVKILVVRFGGGKVYQNLKPLFMGLISAELFAGGLSLLIGFLYYLVTGEVTGIRFKVVP